MFDFLKAGSRPKDIKGIRNALLVFIKDQLQKAEGGEGSNNIKRTRGKGISGMAWGQGELIATPAAVARVASGIANNGTMMPNRYVMSVSGKPAPLKPGVAIAKSPSFAKHLTDYMLKQSANKAQRLGLTVAGKTGTPERIWKSERINDGWYVFFAPKANGPGHIVTCIRLEAAKGSSEAVRLAGTYVIPVLKQRGYIKSFEEEGKSKSALGKSGAPKNSATGNTDSLRKQPATIKRNLEANQVNTAR